MEPTRFERHGLQNPGAKNPRSRKPSEFVVRSLDATRFSSYYFLHARKHRDANFVNILALGLHSGGVSRFREACRRRRRSRSTRLNATDPRRLSPVVSSDSDGQLVGVGALKHPGPGYRNRVFANAQATTASDEYRVELGWVVVAKTHQGRGLSTRIVGELLPFAKNENVFATTRADERVMRYASDYEFEINGTPYPSGRGYDLVLYLRNPARCPDAK
jgi:GNAT superfamily N-acetyltransferase